MPWAASNLLFVMKWPYSFGSAAVAEILGLVHATSQTTNKVADSESRNFDGSTEWSLKMRVLENVNNKWEPFQIDLFVSRLNHKVPHYVSWKPDPGAKFVNAFHMNWANSYFYCFPPFGVIASWLQKI